MILRLLADWRRWTPGALTFAGIVLGLLAAVQDLRVQSVLHGDAAAIVNGHPIMREDLERALAQVGSDRRAALTSTDRLKVLDRLIEDELLAQRAVALGLAVSDPNARKVLIRGLIDSVIAPADEPTEAELRSYFESHREMFRIPGTISVAPIPAGAAPGLPTTAMTLDKLKDYLGSDADQLAPLVQGARAGPFKFAGATFDLIVTARRGGALQTFEAARPQVLARYALDRDAQRVRNYLEGLKRAAKIERRI